MVYNTQNYRVFGPCPSFGIVETREHDVSETGSASVLWWGGKTPAQLGPIERANLNHWFSEIRYDSVNWIHLAQDGATDQL
jgi:hypothetical protein